MSVATRILLPSEYDGYAAHLKKLTDDDRYNRFIGLITDEWIDSYVERVRKNANDAVIAHYNMNAEIDGAVQLSLIEYVISGVKEKIAELSISVLPESRWQGIAGDLIDHAILHARSLYVDKLTTTCRPSNKRMIDLAKRIGMDVGGDFEEKNAGLPLPAPWIDTVALDAFRQQIWEVDYVIKSTNERMGRFFEVLTAFLPKLDSNK